MFRLLFVVTIHVADLDDLAGTGPLLLASGYEHQCEGNEQQNEAATGDSGH